MKGPRGECSTMDPSLTLEHSPTDHWLQPLSDQSRHQGALFWNQHGKGEARHVIKPKGRPQAPPSPIGFLLITSSPGITGSRIPRAPMKGFWWHLHVGSSQNIIPWMSRGRNAIRILRYGQTFKWANQILIAISCLMSDHMVGDWLSSSPPLLLA